MYPLAAYFMCLRLSTALRTFEAINGKLPVELVYYANILSPLPTKAYIIDIYVLLFYIKKLRNYFIINNNALMSFIIISNNK